MRWKKLGSAISTARMVTRFGDFTENLKWFLKKISDLYRGRTTMKEQCPIQWVAKLIDFFSGIFDNWVFLERINLVKYNTPWQRKWVDWLSSACTLSFLVLSIIEKIVNVYRQALEKTQNQTSKKLFQAFYLLLKK